MNYKKKWNLKKEIFQLSNEKENWEIACGEWEIHGFYEEQDGTCICSHFPITHHYVLRNMLNEERVVVGNVCVGHFHDDLRKQANLIFNGLKRIKMEIEKNPNRELMYYSSSKGFINSKDWDFYLNIYRKKYLSEHELEKKRSLNLKIIDGYNSLMEIILKNISKVKESKSKDVRAATEDESGYLNDDINNKVEQKMTDQIYFEPNKNQKEDNKRRNSSLSEEKPKKFVCAECSHCEKKFNMTTLRESSCGHLTGCQDCWKKIQKGKTKCSICKQEYVMLLT